MSTRSRKKPHGLVALVGTGPGDPALLAVRAKELVTTADLVVADDTVPASILALVSPDATLVGPEGDGVQQLVAASRAGGIAVRLFAGDALGTGTGLVPGVPGRSGIEVAAAVRKARQPLEIVPGLPVEVAVPGFTGIAVGTPYTVADVTDNGISGSGPDWAALAAAPGTLILRTTAGDAAVTAATLVANGRPSDTPVAVTAAGTSTRQRTHTATLGTLGADLPTLVGSRVADPVLVVAGEPARKRERVSWWEDRPLAGWRVLVPRTREQAGALVALLRGLGADAIEVPTIAVEPPRTPAPMERAIRGLVGGRYAWVAFTSANAVRAIREKLEESGLDARAFSGVKVAAIGDATAAALLDLGIRADLVPSGQQTSEGLLLDFPPHDRQLDLLDRVLLPRADIATETLAAGLKARGWAIDDVTAYRTVRASPPPLPIREALRSGGIDAVLFTSSSTVRNLVALAGRPHESTTIGVIGPQTAATATELGLRIDLQPGQAGVEELVEELAAHVARLRVERAEAAAAAGVPLAGGSPRPARKAPAGKTAPAADADPVPSEDDGDGAAEAAKAARKR
jgi:uroporphyrinogen III methyltransferase/synthase